MKKLYLIELLRFLSAFSVVVYHYQIYFFQMNYFNDVKILENLETLPFNLILNLLYKFGDYGVHMFFCISGFIMSYVYLEKTEHTNAKTFFVSRFSRLYPLHFLTLILAIIIFYISNLDMFSGMIKGDFKHIILNLFLIQKWGLENFGSFNEPSWSVSIELLLYIVFFAAFGAQFFAS